MQDADDHALVASQIRAPESFPSKEGVCRQRYGFYFEVDVRRIFQLVKRRDGCVNHGSQLFYLVICADGKQLVVREEHYVA